MEAMHPDCAANFAKHSERIHSLEDHRTRQNGSLQRIEARLDHLGWALAGILGAVSIQLALTILRGCVK